ncbi:hypothetical protein BOTBODRAFT_145873 [Botryobasidium botryosum FD-172 SS1]|uniref:F-box domain-containing protein n=1 Tax=Botryobasidium botryosum (strain FD-172 SS1) TaxID=930990 RepID=A0A067MDZ5_BOTB1|nr:hypothetical protein BOTBODRAFT_145873 [Botryobasidium botryosum FD-172 SS1]
MEGQRNTINTAFPQDLDAFCSEPSGRYFLAVNALTPNLKSLENQAVPVYRLPNEILSYIFELANVPHPTQDLSRWSVSQVSRLWQQTALHTPRIWSTICISNHRAVEACVIRSGSAPLDIDLYIDHAYSAHLTDFQGYMDILVPHMNRWRSLEFNGVPTKVYLPYLLSPAPQLEKLIIGMHYTNYRLPLESVLFAGSSPRLRELLLANAHIPLISPIYTGLTDLALFNASFNTSTISHLRSVLRACPQLHALHLEEIHLGSSSAAASSAPDPGSIELPYLSFITARGVEPELVHGVLVSVHPSPSLELQTYIDMESQLDRLGSVLPLESDLSRTLPNLSRVERVAFQFGLEEEDVEGVGYFYLAGETRSGVSVLDLTYVSMYPTSFTSTLLRAIGETLHFPSLKWLEFVGLSNALFSAEQFAELLEHLPSITQLDFKHCSASFIETLAVTPTRHLCPRLRHLVIDHSNISGSGLETVLESRNEAGEGDAEGRYLMFGVGSLHVSRCEAVGAGTLERLRYLVDFYLSETQDTGDLNFHTNLQYMLD